MKNFLNYLLVATSVLVAMFIAKDLYQIVFDFDSFLSNTWQSNFITTYALLLVFLIDRCIKRSSELFNKDKN